MPVTYSLELRPQSVLLGERAVAILRCVSTGESADALTFGHKTLVLECNVEGWPEPLLTFPNRLALERGGMIIRTSPPGGTEDLHDDEERTRVFDLADLFPEVVLKVGTFSLTYWMEEASPPAQPLPVQVEIYAGPESILLLIDRLQESSPELRQDAATLLQKMSGREFENPADWSQWWAEEGSRLPWNYESDGATFGETPLAAPPANRGHQLGGVAYPASLAKPHE